MIRAEEELTSVYVGNLPASTTPRDLYQFFCTFGEIRAIEIPTETGSGRPRGFAFIQFDEHEDAMSAIDNYDRTLFQARTIRVRKARPLEAKYSYNQAVWNTDEWLRANNQAELQASQARLDK
jgi:peptidyl-prolyl isomerase E (cyclophilin E)